MSKSILNYGDLGSDVELQIFNINFNVNFTEEYITELQSIDVDIADDNSFKKMRILLDKVLGEGAYEKISTKYLADKKQEMGIGVMIKIYAFLMNAYKKSVLEIQNTNFKR